MFGMAGASAKRVHPVPSAWWLELLFATERAAPTIQVLIQTDHHFSLILDASNLPPLVIFMST